jgi:hypothetical protein
MASGFAMNRRRHLNRRSTRTNYKAVDVVTDPKKPRGEQSELC